ncbi:MAG: threonine/serine exporter family protein [Eubacterium sp.]
MISIISSILGTLGFCAILNVPKRKIIWVIIGAAISASIFEVLYSFEKFSIFTATMLAAMAIGIYSEIMARKTKTPATVILLPSTIPLLPGGSLYYAMSYLVAGNHESFAQYAAETISTGCGIAVGAIVTSIALKLILHRH